MEEDSLSQISDVDVQILYGRSCAIDWDICTVFYSIVRYGYEPL